MTEAAMGADAPGAPIDVEGASHTHELGSQTPPAPEKVEVPEKPSGTAREAIQKANEAIKARQAEADKKAPEKPDIKADTKEGAKPEGKSDAKPEAKPDTKIEQRPAQPRGEGGKFASAEPKPDAQPQRRGPEAPASFDPAAKAEWEKTPDSVKGATLRRFQEMEQGIAKYKVGSDAYESYRELDDIAKSHGKRGADVFREYFNMENHLRQDLVGGLDGICQRMGYSLRQVAEHVLNQTPDQNAAKQDQTIRELRGEIAELKQGLGSVTENIQQQRHDATLQEVTKFAADHPRFEELANDIGFFIQTRRAKNLTEAYEMAERLNPAASVASELQPVRPANNGDAAQTRDDKPLNPAGQKSISGAPQPGSDPARKGPIPSTREALKRAMARAGV